VKPVVRVVVVENTDGAVLQRRRQYEYPEDVERGLGAYVDSLDLLGEWKDASAEAMDAEMRGRYERWAQGLLEVTEAEPEPVDPQAMGDVLDATAATLQQALDAIAAIRPPGEPQPQEE
jgi:hypothetical protein